MKEATIRVCSELAAQGVRGAQLIAQIHDEIMFEVPEVEAEKAIVIIRQKMEHVWESGGLLLPVTVQSGRSWGEMA